MSESFFIAIGIPLINIFPYSVGSPLTLKDILQAEAGRGAGENPHGPHKYVCGSNVRQGYQTKANICKSRTNTGH